MTFYAHVQEGVINGCGQCRCLNADIENVVISEEVYNNIGQYIYADGEIILNPNYEEEQAQLEKARIQELCMTRSDFFDATIKAFGADADDLLQALSNILKVAQLDPVEKKIALNNYKNALNFYRKHPLFTILSAMPITIGEQSIAITADQWDKFFDETDKRNPEAYKNLV